MRRLIATAALCLLPAAAHAQALFLQSFSPVPNATTLYFLSFVYNTTADTRFSIQTFDGQFLTGPVLWENAATVTGNSTTQSYVVNMAISPTLQYALVASGGGTPVGGPLSYAGGQLYALFDDAHGYIPLTTNGADLKDLRLDYKDAQGNVLTTPLTPMVAPEPSTFILMATAGLVLLAWRRHAGLKIASVAAASCVPSNVHDGFSADVPASTL